MVLKYFVLALIYILIQKQSGIFASFLIIVGCLLIEPIQSFVKKYQNKYVLQHQYPFFSTQGTYQSSLEEYYEPQCQICLESFHPSDTIVELKCGCQIIYHKDCLFLWLQQEMTCPVCKISMKDLMI